jgi:hypothetical protein
MHRSENRILGIVGVVLLLGSGPGWAGPPPNPTASDPTLFNTAGGSGALAGNTTGADNTAFGYGALLRNTGGVANTASGTFALLSNIGGSYNTASGYAALYYNIVGNWNTASGYGALQHNTTGDGNTASGFFALFSNTTGQINTASGFKALYRNTTGNENTASGFGAGFANTTGSFNTFIGFGADANAGTYSNGTALGSGATVTASNSIVLGNTSISKIYAQVTSITAISDRRHKKDIAALDAGLGLDFIQKLQPVSYRFNNGDETERYGFIAQDLEMALPAALHDTIEGSPPEHGLALIERQNDTDRTYRVSYGELFAPVVKSIQQQQQEIAAERQERQQEITALKAEIAALRHSIEAPGRQQASAAR